ncbi:MAG: dATP pyrophosphohydrolase [Janthinobacterium lividum]
MTVPAEQAGDARVGGVGIVAVQGRAGLERFIRLPERLYRGDPSYVAPLRQERRDALTAGKNPFFEHAEAAFWVATRGGEDVGRISAQQDRLARPGADGPVGHFGMLAAIDDADVFAALLAVAEGWLAARGLRMVQGPFSLSINEESGLLVEGFDTPPMLMMPHDPPYADARLRALGYGKVRDLFAYLCDTTAALPPAAAAVVARGLPSNVVLRPMRRADIKGDVAAIVEIFNDGWDGHWGFVPLTPAEVDHMARAMKPLLVERLVWFAEVDGEPAAFGLCLPNLNAAIADLGGRLLPLGWARLLWRLKVAGVATARVPLMGVRRKFEGSLLGGLLPLHVVEALRREALACGIKAVEMSWVLEDNLPMRRLAEGVGGRAYKTYRVYEKRLAA